MKRASCRCLWLILILGILGGAKAGEAGLSETLKILKESKAPATITAQEMEYMKENIVVAKGDVVIKQEDTWLTAQKITINMTTGDFEAEGNVVWVDPEGRFEGDYAKFNQKTGLGYIVRGKGYLGPDQFIQGDFIQRVATKELRVHNAVFSGCESCEGRRDWELRSKDMYVYVDDTAQATNLSLWVKETLPVFYFPYLTTPAAKRKSGFLIPTVGFSGGQGFYAQNAYFLNISDSQDLTFYLLNRTAQGVGGSLEYRYIWARGHGGYWLFHYFYQYQPVGENRWYVKGGHTSDFTERASLKVDVDYINNRDYERQYADDVLDRSKRYAFSQAFVTQNWDQVQALAVARYVEDLPRKEKNIPQRLPELRLTVTPVKLGPLPAYFDFYGNLVHFHRIEGFEVERLNIRPSLFAVINLWPYLTITPRAGIRESLYSRDSDGRWGGFNRFSYEGRVTAQGRYALGFGIASYQFRVVLEPKVEYQYVPDVDRPSLPHIDFQDFEFAQNRLLYAMGTRLYMRRPQQLSENIELAGLSVYSDYSFIDRQDRFARLGNFDDFSITDHQGRFGNVYTRLVVHYPDYLRWSMLTLYNPLSQQFRHINAEVNFSYFRYWEAHFSSAYNKNIDGLFFTSGVIIKPLPELKIRVLARYDARHNIFHERRVSLTYEACCWSVTLTYVRDRNLSGRERDSFRMSLDLKNISGVGLR